MTSIDDYFNHRDNSKALFEILLPIIKDTGNSEMSISKSQIAFHRKKAFAWVWIPGKYLRGKTAPLVLTIALPYRDPSHRWKEVVEQETGHFIHHLELFTNADIDSEASDWLRTAWEQAG